VSARPDPQVALRPIVRVTGEGSERLDDAVAVEGPLEIRIGGQSLAVTLRTPGHDRELALGLLAGEGVVRSAAAVAECRQVAAECDDQPDTVDVTLAPGVPLDWTKLERHFAATSACGLCGRAHLESLRSGLRPVPHGRAVDPRALLELPALLAGSQRGFHATGGLHAAALVDERLRVEVVREDVGRHNAVDKVAGWLLERGRYPAGGGVLWVSGRAGAEIVLKAARAGIPVLAAVGAPSSLAITLAGAADMTLVGFLREGRMNVYGGAEGMLR